MEKKISKKTNSNIRKVASIAQINEVRVHKIAMKNELLLTFADEEVIQYQSEIKFLHKGFDKLREQILVAKNGVKVTFHPLGGSPKDIHLSIEVIMDAFYGLNPDKVADVSEKELADFAEINGLFNVWPYLRSEVERISASIRMPFTLPLLRIIVE